MAVEFCSRRILPPPPPPPVVCARLLLRRGDGGGPVGQTDVTSATLRNSDSLVILFRNVL